ncbi:MAG: NADH:ubiquinone reductase (Na(+)-transporting) subunit F [Candidatus Margulisbacteria bacterium]|nr:NADH:ubiquinone reductase (Na(+)-transporting) subunit F [Candidatus Margulisiibacteriota bacterium]
MIYIVSIAVFSLVILGLVAILAVLEKKFVQAGACRILINDDSALSPKVPAGTNLLSALSNQNIFIPSACGGGGSCGMCKVKVLEGGGDILPTEFPHLTRKERAENVRLSCQLKVKNHMNIQVPDEVFSVKKFECEVVSNHNVATFIKELTLRLPADLDMDFKAGGYIQIDVPEFKHLKFSDFTIEDQFQQSWEQFSLFNLVCTNDEASFRAYSMANYPEEKGIIKLNVRIATPPPGKDVNPGVGSSYLFNLAPGDSVMVSGPYGEFFAKETKREMCFIGGGAGMAPMRSHIFDQLKRLNTKRKMTFWYGARSKSEMFYDEEFKLLQDSFKNFKYYVALSDPQPEDGWEGHTGFIHQVLLDEYLSNHDDPTDIEYYICGPPLMLSAMKGMLHDLGVESNMIAYDDFGS